MITVKKKYNNQTNEYQFHNKKKMNISTHTFQSIIPDAMAVPQTRRARQRVINRSRGGGWGARRLGFCGHLWWRQGHVLRVYVRPIVLQAFNESVLFVFIVMIINRLTRFNKYTCQVFQESPLQWKQGEMVEQHGLPQPRKFHYKIKWE